MLSSNEAIVEKHKLFKSRGSVGLFSNADNCGNILKLLKRELEKGMFVCVKFSVNMLPQTIQFAPVHR